MIDESSRTFTNDDLPAPKELDDAMKTLIKNSGSFTLKNVMRVCVIGVKLAEQYPDRRRGIADALRDLLYDYDELGDEGDLYKLRYCRLVPEIEDELDILFTYPSEDAVKGGKTLAQHWTTLKWLVEDQQKIIS